MTPDDVASSVVREASSKAERAAVDVSAMKAGRLVAEIEAIYDGSAWAINKHRSTEWQEGEKAAAAARYKAGMEGLGYDPTTTSLLEPEVPGGSRDLHMTPPHPSWRPMAVRRGFQPKRRGRGGWDVPPCE